MYIFHSHTPMKLFIVFCRIFAVLPPFLVSFMAYMLGHFLYFIVPYRKKVIVQQMRKCIGNTMNENELRKLARKNYVHYAYVFFESLVIASFGQKPTDYYEKHFQVIGKNDLLKAVGEKRGVLLIGGHIGFWEAYGHWLAQYVAPVTIPVKIIKNGFIQSFREHMQAYPGVTLIDNRSGGRIKDIMRALHRGHMVGLFLDQYRPSEEFVRFFGFAARTNSAAAVLAKRTGAALVYSYVVRERFGKYHMHFERVELPAFQETQDEKTAIIKANECFNSLLEKTIRAYPDQWFWAHRRFKENPEFTY
jgi:Kdo2-lipid IVA lauroyltransferase/acyltransferase